MSWKKEPCRNFQRGSCRYGDQCKFLHVSQQQSKPNNPFGYGAGRTSQAANIDHRPFQQRQQSNPCGFGVQSGSQARVASAFGSGIQTSAKPFENKWVRGKDPTPEQATQPRTVDHKCTDPESCKQLISDDMKHEQPLWKLTCYGHFKGLPCDISGDISYEELRATAYEEAKQGRSLQMIIERERNLLNSKVQEFTSLLNKPYATSKPSSMPMANQFPNYNTASPNSQSSLPQSAFRFGKSIGPTTSTGPNVRSPFLATSFSAVGQTDPFQNQNQIFQASAGTSGPYGSSLPGQTFGASLGSIGSDGKNELQGDFFSAPSNRNSKVEDKVTNPDIWLKEKWEIKEIPEEEPPQQFCR